MGGYTFFVIHISSIILALFLLDHLAYCGVQSTVHIGVALDLNSPMGSMADLSIRMAVSDFYLAHPNYTTRLQLHTNNANSLFDANFAEMEKKRLLVRTTPDDLLQAQALAALCQGFEFSEVVFLYEDTDNGNMFLSYLKKAFQEVEFRLSYIIPIPTLVEDSQILKELKRLTTKQTRVFLVHMNPSLGYRLFTLAKRLGFMTEGYAWLISDSLSNFMSSMDSVDHELMEGVVGIRPYIHQSEELKDFRERWKRNMLVEKTTGSTMELNVYGLWAYDAVTALAIALEKIGPINSTSFYIGTNNTNLRISTIGPELLNELSRTRFKGLSGDFQLFDGKMKQSAFEIFNVYGSGEKTIGFWTSDRGIIRELSPNDSTSTKILKTVIWPGDSTVRPKAWAIPESWVLRVGIPWKFGSTERVNATVDPVTNHTNATGFAIDIFLAALDVLPFPR